MDGDASRSLEDESNFCVKKAPNKVVHERKRYGIRYLMLTNAFLPWLRKHSAGSAGARALLNQRGFAVLGTTAH